MKKTLFLVSTLFVAACSTGGGKKASKDTLSFVPYRHLLEDKVTKANQCPSSTKSWSLSNNKTVLDLANACVKAKEWKMLDALGEHLALKLPEAPWGPYYMSLAAEGAGKLPRALWMASLAVKKAPNLNIMHYHKGRLEWSLGDGVAASDSMKQVLKLDSDFVEANFFLANLYFQDQDYKSSLAYFKQVLKSKPSHSQSLIGAGESSYKLDSKSSAQSYFELAIDQVPSNLALRMRLADLYESNKNFEQALYHYRKIREQSSRQRGPASQQLADLPLKIKELEKEVAKLEKKKVSKTNSEKNGGV